MPEDVGVRAISRPEVPVVGGPPKVAREDGALLEVQPLVAAEAVERPGAELLSEAHQSAEQVVAARRAAPVDLPVAEQAEPGVREEH